MMLMDDIKDIETSAGYLFLKSLKLINSCLENGVLIGQDGGVFIYRMASENSPEGWYLEDKEDVAREVASDSEGRLFLMAALEEKGIIFK